MAKKSNKKKLSNKEKQQASGAMRDWGADIRVGE